MQLCSACENWVEHVVACKNGVERVAASKKMATWTRQETLKLIEVWERKNIQAQLEGCKRNQKVFETITRELQSGG